MTFDTSVSTPEEYGEEMRRHLREDRPATIPSPVGEHDVTYQPSESGEEARIEQTLPEGVMVELADGTVGPMVAYRVDLTDAQGTLPTEGDES